MPALLIARCEAPRVAVVVVKDDDGIRNKDGTTSRSNGDSQMGKDFMLNSRGRDTMIIL
jgi:hypothetical protein